MLVRIFAITACWAVAAAIVSGSGVARANPALEGYRNYQQVTEEVQALAELPVVSTRSLGTTLGGREIHLLTIGEPGEAKPAILIVGHVHGPQLVGTELALRMARILSQQDREEVRRLLERVVVYVLPLPSPDAGEKCFLAPFRERPGNARPTDDDRDFEIGEDPANDLNGDGWITLMRVLDETGSYLPHPEEPRVLIQADATKGERGQYRLYVEGTDDDGDGQFNEDGGSGVSFNRNFTFRYPHFGMGAGPNAVSEVETRAIADFALDHPQIAAVFTFTPDDNLLNPWKSDSADDKTRIKQHIAKADEPYHNRLAERYREIHGGQDAPTSPRGEGSFSEWAYFHYGRWSLAGRAWWIPQVPLPEGKEIKESRGADELKALRWLDQQKIDAFVPWSPVEHPDFPHKQVEVGGIKPFYLWNPPAAELDALAEKHVAFVLHLGESLPKLEVAETTVDALGGGVFRVTAKVINRGFLPTMADVGETSQRAYPLRLEIAVDQPVQWIQGHPRGQLPRLPGSGGSAEASWLVRVTGEASATARLTVSAPAVGSSEAVLKLE